MCAGECVGTETGERDERVSGVEGEERGSGGECT